ncbi:MAG: energy transducer TonB [Alphaproteobacteria bacterium]
MRVRGGIFALVCAGVGFAGPHVAQAQEATSAHLPDQFQTGATTSSSKSKKARGESNSQTFATTPRQKVAPTPKPTPLAEELPPVLTKEEKTPEPGSAVESKTSNSTSAYLTKSAPPEEESAPVERKPRSRKRSRPRPAVQSVAPSVAEPVPISLSVAQSMAITAPLPKYPYEAKRRHLIGSGICVLTVDTDTGKVTDVTMTQSTGSRFLDRFTVQTFKEWRFKPGTVSQFRIPISYE